MAWTVHRLWKPQAAAIDQRLARHDDIMDMLDRLARDPDFEDFYRRYEDIFRTRSEDAGPGMNVTSLDTHVRLVGRFYRFLRKSSALKVAEEEVRRAVDQGLAAAERSRATQPAEANLDPAQIKPVADLREQKKREWRIHQFRCRPRILPNPFRARDLNIFGFLKEFLNEVQARFGDHLLFASTDEVLLYSDSPDLLEQIRLLAAPRGIQLEVDSKKKNLIEADTKLSRDWRAESPPPPVDTIKPPLCELCQMHPATKVWPRDYLASSAAEDEEEIQEGTDYLCETCFVVRSCPSRLRKLAHWEDWAQGDIIWARVRLDFSRLCETLHQLYWGYLRSLDPVTPEEKAEVRFSLLGEFQRDYDSYLGELARRLVQHFGEERTERVLPSLFCLKADTGEDVFKVLRGYLRTLQDFFPAFLGDAGSPLVLSVAISDVRYPFFEVWRAWQDQRSEVEILAVGHGELCLAARHLERFLKLADFPFRRSALHNLAEISRISQQLAELRFRARGERDERQTLEHLSEFLPLGLDFSGILTLAKLKGA